MAIAADDSENLDGMWAAHGQALLSGDVLEASVEEPLVDLDPKQASFCHGLFTNLSVQLSVVLLVESGQDLHLIVRFALAVGVRDGAGSSFSIPAQTFAGEFDRV